MALYRPLGCCSSGPVGFGAAAGDDLDPDTLALLARRQAAQATESSTITVDSPTDPPPSSSFPWGKLLAVSVTAGLALHYLTKRGRR